MYKRFDQLAQFFTSLSAVMIGLMCLIAFMVFETQTLFFHMLPEMGGVKRLFASILVAFVFEFSVLITTANTANMHKRVPVVLAFCGFILIVWFWRAWEGAPVLIFYKFFVSALQAYLNFLYSDLFMKKWNEKGMLTEVSELKTKLSYLETNLGLSESKIKERDQKLKEIERNINERKDLLNQLTCPHCGEVMKNQNGFNAHVGRCKKNQAAIASMN